ncbi:MAG: carboxylating nicotinate-nucleotide diphosphorylase [Candidatus Nanopelagicales bacterium]|nr:carboxylating nicotinate-nucleotide diphosphorylase [Candidatus Nanopelagicales bacterium]MDP4715088.1 carboxylating nicotinate-nucleotide diphosphorylase [Candidatus Nanopelagicales bacterium]MDP4906877.1 carboxylating nicotinate-nucleotide diphosphorylase [Candidatus Nanopelagicales bacterium]MDP4974395.1 carboxylating nicotinate-nucleotide diphosphorylase [Candidatus Nanopelagicales bacterium]MDP5094883.1 carboxylating nicotinate-nucleotide diphosphorylase [Candidatus Nanopelagicales bact
MNPDDQLAAAGLDPVAVADLIDRALAEDLDGGVDVTSVATTPVDSIGTLDLVARAPGVIAGSAVAAAVFARASQGRVRSTWMADGAVVASGDVIVSATGPVRDLLLAERTALNLLCHLSGVATLTRRWVDALGDSTTRVRDTRKTTPGLRRLEKYAVRCGGGVNHRMSLSDAALVKDNHVAAAGGVAEAFDRVRRAYPDVPVEVEVDSLEQLDDVLVAGADLVLLDNFTPDQMREAVARTRGRAVLEASGGLTLDVAHEVGRTGVDYVAVGALTHSSPILDVGADLREGT